MARRRSATPRDFERHPGISARTSDTWTTRYYTRKNDPLFDLLGLMTIGDDLHKKQGSSPNLSNVRFFGEREGEQRAQVMSRAGTKLKGVLGEEIIPRSISDGTMYTTISETKAIEWVLDHNKRLSGLLVYLYNIEKATGFVKVTVRDLTTKAELANAVIDTSLISQSGFGEHPVRFINTIAATRVIIRLEVFDDVSNDGPRTPRSIRVLADGSGTHEYAMHALPNVNEALEEVPYEFAPASGKPLAGVIINDWQPMIRCIDVVSGGQKYIIFPAKSQGIISLYRLNVTTNALETITDRVNNKAEFVRFDQAEGILYYVDGISPLREINLTTWVAQDSIPKQSEITLPGVKPETLKAKEGASLIHYLNSRLYLSGFKDDPNLIIMSLIDDIKPRFNQFNDRFYSPDQSPQLSAGSPITALEDQADYLVVFRVDGVSLYDRGGSTTLDDASMVTPEGSQLGVLNQEAVCKGKNNIYFFNPVEGVQRFGGSVNRTVSGDIENLLNRIQHKDKVFMLCSNQRVRMYFSFEGDQPDQCLYYYADQDGKLPWYLDTSTPIGSAVALKDDKHIYAIHNQVPAVMEIEAENQFTDFDSGFWLEYDTQYHVPPTGDPSGFTFIRRIHVHEIADSNHSMFIGLDVDHQNRPIVWRRYIEVAAENVYNPDAVFQQTAEAGTIVHDLMMYVRCRNYQIRLKRFCYNEQAEIVGVGVEYGNKEAI